MVLFKFPSSYAEPDPGELESRPQHLHVVGTHIAVELVVEYRRPRTYVARIEGVHASSDLYSCQLLHIPKDQVYGPWARRPWHPWVDGVVTRKELISHADVIAVVELDSNNALTQSSLEKLAAAKVNVSGTPHQEMSLPPRRL